MKRHLLLFFAVALLAQSAVSQEKPAANKPEKVYKIDFTFSELEGGKKINSRQYTVVQAERSNQPSTLRVGNRVPVVTGGNNDKDSRQWQYIDLGVSLDWSLLKEENGILYMRFITEMSGALQPQQSGTNSGIAPVLRRFRQELQPAVPIGKPTIVSTVDDPNSKRTYQLEITATPLK